MNTKKPNNYSMQTAFAGQNTIPAAPLSPHGPGQCTTHTQRVAYLSCLQAPFQIVPTHQAISKVLTFFHQTTPLIDKKWSFCPWCVTEPERSHMFLHIAAGNLGKNSGSPGPKPPLHPFTHVSTASLPASSTFILPWNHFLQEKLPARFRTVTLLPRHTCCHLQQKPAWLCTRSVKAVL